MRVRRLPYINSSHNRQFFDASSLSIMFNEEYRQYPNICARWRDAFGTTTIFARFYLLFSLRFVGLNLHFSLQRGSGGTDHVSLMESVRHELEYSSFFSIFRTCIYVYSKKPPPDFKRKKMTLLLPATCIAPCNTC